MASSRAISEAKQLLQVSGPAAHLAARLGAITAQVHEMGPTQTVSRLWPDARLVNGGLGLRSEQGCYALVAADPGDSHGVRQVPF